MVNIYKNKYKIFITAPRTWSQSSSSTTKEAELSEAPMTVLRNITQVLGEEGVTERTNAVPAREHLDT